MAMDTQSNLIARIQDRSLEAYWASYELMNPLSSISDRSTIATPSDRKINWHENVTQALNQAQLEHKPLVVVFQEENCDWCKQFEKELTNPLVSGSVSGDAVFLKISPSKDKEARTLANYVNVQGYPSAAVLQVDKGKISTVARMSGYMPAQQFVYLLRAAFAQVPGQII